jgi:hypothetical protein
VEVKETIEWKGRERMEEEGII